MGIFTFTVLLVVALTDIFSIQLTTAQSINYFGVAFSPYVKKGPPYPYWDSYTLAEIKQMLRIILTKHNSISTYGMGVASNEKNLNWSSVHNVKQ